MRRAAVLAALVLIASFTASGISLRTHVNSALASGPCGAAGTFTDSPLTCTYSTGNDTFTVPDHVSQVTFDVFGAQGGGVRGTTTFQGGMGGESAGTFAVSAGQIYQVDVGQQGGDGQSTLDINFHINPNRGGGDAGGGGVNGDSVGGLGGAPGGYTGTGGGGGGGASDVRFGSCAATLGCALADRILVAGGGGGSSMNDNSAGYAPGGGGNNQVGSAGFNGNGLFAGAGANGGGAGTDFSGGTGGAGGTGYGGGTGGSSGNIGTPGKGGQGGLGGTAAVSAGGAAIIGQDGTGGGGGGGGANGGGGGGGGGGSGFDSGAGSGGGGGGGGAYFSPSAANPVFQTGVHSGDGTITVTWKFNPTISTPHSASVTIGQQLSASSSLSDGYQPSGTITFKLFGPTDPTCTTPKFTSARPVSGAAATSTGYPTTAVGTYTWIADYGGDINNNPAGPTSCSAPGATVEVTPAVPTLTTHANPTAPVTGTSFADTATLAGGYNPTGALSFTLYGAPGCAGTPTLTTSSFPVNGNGNYQSGTFVAPLPATYYWTAGYTGDTNNLAATSGCNADPVTVLKIPQTVTFTTSPPSPAIYGGSYQPLATGGGSGNPVVFSIDAGSSPGVCTIAGGIVHFTHVGLCKVDAIQAGDALYAVGQAQQSIDVGPAALTVTAGSASMVFGTAVPPIVPSYTGLVNGDSAPPTLPTCAAQVPPANILNGNPIVGTYPTACTGAADANYTISYVGGSLVVGKATPILQWSQPSPITYPTALGPAQLNATASVPGTFAYTPPAGAVLNAGPNQTLSATFTPSDSANYVSGGFVTTTITVNKAGTSTSLTSSVNPVNTGQAVTYRATITGPGSAGGTVAFLDGGVTIAGCGAVLVAGNQATCVVTYASRGAHAIVAVYSGDLNRLGSTSPLLGETVVACGSSLVGCNLQGANLCNADLAGSNLSYANLNTAKLCGTNLAGANLTGANLNGADLTGANLQGAITTGANFNNVIWSNTTCPDGTNSNANGGTCQGHL